MTQSQLIAADAGCGPRPAYPSGKRPDCDPRRAKCGAIKDLAFFDDLLIVFAAVALFVGRLPHFQHVLDNRGAASRDELALLRAVGASQGQVTRSVLGEALVIGLVASWRWARRPASAWRICSKLRSKRSASIYRPPAWSSALGPSWSRSGFGGGGDRCLGRAPGPPGSAGDAGRGHAGPGQRRWAAVPQAGGHGRGGDRPRWPLLLAVGLLGRSSQLIFVGAGAAGVFVGLAMLGPLVARPIPGPSGHRWAEEAYPASWPSKMRCVTPPAPRPQRLPSWSA